MVYSDYCRRGIIYGIYEICFEQIPLVCAKGTDSGMIRLRQKLRFQPEYAVTNLAKLLSPHLWLMGKVGVRRYPRSVDYRENERLC